MRCKFFILYTERQQWHLHIFCVICFTSHHYFKAIHMGDGICFMLAYFLQCDKFVWMIQFYVNSRVLWDSVFIFRAINGAAYFAISRVMISWICVLNIITIIKPEVLISSHCYETMVCAVCLVMFLWWMIKLITTIDWNGAECMKINLPTLAIRSWYINICTRFYWHDDIVSSKWFHVSYVVTVRPVYNDHLMGYFSAFWSSSRWPRAT